MKSLLIALAITATGMANASAAPIETTDQMLKKIEWLGSGHPYGSACVRINGSKVIYFDPSGISDDQTRIKADLILITHCHDDHYSEATLKKLKKDSTRIVIVSGCAAEKDSDRSARITIAAGETKKVDGIEITAVPAYSLTSKAHPKSEGWVGYVVTIDGVRLYHSGDTSFIPEMKNLKDIDIAFFDVRGPYQMSGKEVIEAIHTIKPKVAIPIHWLKAEESDIEYIRKNAPSSTRVVILAMK
jgi:L-ascorbate metabolism protein UlaG (beta-lactamase superfamily)